MTRSRESRREENPAEGGEPHAVKDRGEARVLCRGGDRGDHGGPRAHVGDADEKVLRADSQRHDEDAPWRLAAARQRAEQKAINANEPRSAIYKDIEIKLFSPKFLPNRRSQSSPGSQISLGPLILRFFPYLLSGELSLTNSTGARLSTRELIKILLFKKRNGFKPITH